MTARRNLLIVSILASLAASSCSLPTGVPLRIITGRVRVVANLADAGGTPTGTQRIEDADSLRVYLVHSGARIDSTRTVAGGYRFANVKSGTYLAVLQLERIAADTSGSIIVSGANVVVTDTLVLARRGNVAAIPNPFPTTARISFAEPTSQYVRLAIVTFAGSPIRLIFDGPSIAGLHDEIWDGRDGAGLAVANGRYGVMLQVGAEGRTDVVFKGP